ncbi:glycosyltransferase family A protein [Phaeovulum sp.]|uniref:glycosyltransferase family A protein n=1 Tax=Phaeovulum sp. TaxID=2934796 RepID=UPI0039E563CA
MRYAVAIPAFNAAQTIHETLASIVNQTIAPVEIVVVDDGSSDNTTDIVEQFGHGVRLIRQANAGCGAATTAAINATSAPIMATVDADDLWVRDKLERQLASLNGFGADTLSFTRMRQFRHEDPERGSGRVQDGWGRSTLVMHRSSFEKVGPIIDPPGNCGDMVDWIGRARQIGLRTHMLPQVLALRRIISSSMTFNLNNDQRRAYLAVARASMLRQREATKK